MNQQRKKIRSPMFKTFQKKNGFGGKNKSSKKKTTSNRTGHIIFSLPAAVDDINHTRVCFRPPLALGLYFITRREQLPLFLRNF
jgi:hypothetical protein